METKYIGARCTRKIVTAFQRWMVTRGTNAQHELRPYIEAAMLEIMEGKKTEVRDEQEV